jgi:sigma-B regulation protein RsbU (phosphoserine phosphatase)
MVLRELFNGKPDPPGDPVQAGVAKLRDADLAAAYYGPRMGGDLYDFIRVHPDRVLFGLLDVAGQAKENSDIVSAAQVTFRERGTALFANDDVNEAEAMMELCLELNRIILQSADGVRECPAFAGCYREGLGTICYFNAGHVPGLLRDQNRITELPATGLPLGLFSHVVWNANTVALPLGAALLLVSRGVAEAQWDEPEFGLEGLKEYFLQSKAQDASELCKTLLAQASNSAASMHNDLTALALVRPL